MIFCEADLRDQLIFCTTIIDVNNRTPLSIQVLQVPSLLGPSSPKLRFNLSDNILDAPMILIHHHSQKPTSTHPTLLQYTGPIIIIADDKSNVHILRHRLSKLLQRECIFGQCKDCNPRVLRDLLTHLCELLYRNTIRAHLHSKRMGGHTFA